MRRGILALALLLFPTLVLAQAETSGRVTGTVVDEAQKPLAGAEIVIESPALQGGQRKTTSDAEGKFLAALLPPGVYMLTVSASGKAPQQYSVRLGVGQTIPIDPVLKTGDAITEEIVVLAPAVKMQTTAGGENFSYEGRIDLLPVTDRRIDFVATLAPNISFGPTRDTLSISGAPSYDNSVLLDGSDISDPFYSGGAVVYLEEAIEEVQVLTNGVSARYGRFQGGVLNATTKSGGNTFDGTFRTDLSKQSWNSKTPFNEPQSDDLNQVYSATLGGPIVKDHLTFFVGGRTIPALSEAHSQLVVPGSFTTETNEDRYQIKLTGSVNANHSIEASYLWYERERTNYDPFQWVAEPTAIIPVRTDPIEFYTAEYQGVLTERTFLNAQMAKKDLSITAGGNPNLPSPILELFDGEYRAYANGWWDPDDPSVRNSESAAINLIHNLAGGNWAPTRSSTGSSTSTRSRRGTTGSPRRGTTSI